MGSLLWIWTKGEMEQHVLYGTRVSWRQDRARWNRPMSELGTRGVLAIAEKIPNRFWLPWQLFLGTITFSRSARSILKEHALNIDSFHHQLGQKSISSFFPPVLKLVVVPSRRPSPRARELLESYFTKKMSFCLNSIAGWQRVNRELKTSTVPTAEGNIASQLNSCYS